MDPGPVQSVARALAALDQLAAAEARGQGVPLQALAEALGLRASTARNIVKTMTLCGYVAQTSDRKYRLGPRCRDLTRAALLGDRLRQAIAAAAHGLAAEIGETVVAATLLGGRRVPLLQVEGGGAVRVDGALEDHDRLYELVTGRVLLAFARPDERREALARHGWPGPQWCGITDEGALERTLEAIRQAGYAEDLTSAGEVWAVASPVRDGDGGALAAIGLFMPAYRATSERRSEVLAALTAAARRCEGELRRGEKS